MFQKLIMKEPKNKLPDIEAHHQHHQQHQHQQHQQKQHQQHQQQQHHVDEHHEQRRRGCRPFAFLLSFPFALCALLLSFAGAIVWMLGSMLSYVCPCLSCCADLANSAMDVIKWPIDIFRWFIDKIPC